eukprot:c47062_g1_i1 orf=284-1126(-)
MSERVEQETMAASTRPLFVLFGASMVQYSFDIGGWGAILADLYSRQADILLRGYAGWNTRRALEKLEEIFPQDSARQPALVIVFFGGNDSMAPHPTGLGCHVPLPECTENIRKIATHIMGLSETTRVIFISCPPVNEDMTKDLARQLAMLKSVDLPGKANDLTQRLIRSNDIARQYSEACINVCKELGLKYVDLWSTIQTRPDWRSSCLSDGLHLAPEGSIVLVEEILKVLKTADWEPSLYWKNMPLEYSDDSPYDPIFPGMNSTLNVSSFAGYRHRQWM